MSVIDLEFPISYVRLDFFEYFHFIKIHIMRLLDFIFIILIFDNHEESVIINENVIDQETSHLLSFGDFFFRDRQNDF